MIFFNVMMYLGSAVIWCGTWAPDFGGLIFGLMFAVIGFMWPVIQVLEVRRKWRAEYNQYMRRKA